MSYENDIRIDPEALDVEWLNQPQLMVKYGEQCADARLDLDMAKEELDVVKAEVGLDIRKNPMDYTGEDKKPTEAAIVNLITTSKRVRDAEKAHTKAKRDYELMLSVCRAFDARKHALQNLVSLGGREYFAQPHEPRDLPHEHSMHEKARKRSEKDFRDRTRDAAKKREKKPVRRGR